MQMLSEQLNASPCPCLWPETNADTITVFTQIGT